MEPDLYRFDKDFLVSEDPERGRVWIALDEASVGFKDGRFMIAFPPSVDDLKDNFWPVEGNDADTWAQRARAWLSSMPNLDRTAAQDL